MTEPVQATLPPKAMKRIAKLVVDTFDNSYTQLAARVALGLGTPGSVHASAAGPSDAIVVTVTFTDEHGTREIMTIPGCKIGLGFDGTNVVDL